MKISSVELTNGVERETPTQLLVLTTDSGASGKAEIPADGDMRERSSVVVADFLVGRNPFDVEALLSDSKCRSDGAIDDVGLVSAATSAMLDLASQGLGTSMAQLLAGSMHERVRACAIDWAQGASDTTGLVDAAKSTVAEGYTLLRLDPFAAQEEIRIDAAAALVGSVRNAVENEVDIVVVGHTSLTVSDAVTFASAIAPFQPLWIEDLVAPWPNAPLERLVERLNQPLAAGRRVSPSLLRELARTTLIDHLIIDVSRAGGLLEARRFAALAEMQHVGVIASGSGGALSLRDALQLASVLPNLTAVEVPRGLAKIENGLVAVHAPSS